jgi:hypothetical protein
VPAGNQQQSDGEHHHRKRNHRRSLGTKLGGGDAESDARCVP